MPSNIADDVKAAIAAALARHADREARDIKILVHNGKVELSGQVQSLAEKQLILGAATAAAGVRSVEDHLLIGI